MAASGSEWCASVMNSHRAASREGGPGRRGLFRRWVFLSCKPDLLRSCRELLQVWRAACAVTASLEGLASRQVPCGAHFCGWRAQVCCNAAAVVVYIMVEVAVLGCCVRGMG